MSDLGGEGLKNLLGVVGPFVHHLTRRLTCHHSNTRDTGRDTTLLHEPGPRAVLLVLSNTEAELACVPKRRTVKLAGNTAKHVNENQSHCPADGGVGTVARPKDAMRSIHTDGCPYRTIDDNELRTPTSASGAAVKIEILVTQSAQSCYDNRHVSRQTACHDCIDCHFFRGDRPLANGFHPNHVCRRQTSRVQAVPYSLFGRRHNRQAIGP